MPICMADTMTELTILRISGNDKIREHLSNLGFVPGETVMVVSRIDDNIIIKVKGVSLAISHELARRIMV